LSDEAKPYVHFGATSYDIVATALSLQLRAATTELVIPRLIELEKTLLALTDKYAETVQIGRTHGQHAVPITFGFAMAQYVSRLGQRLEQIVTAAANLRGKFAGAVGAYNALALYRPADPAEVEAMLMRRLGLTAPEVSTQIVQ